MSGFGVSGAGFTNKRQSDWDDDIKAAMLSHFGSTVNLGPATVLGQISSILAERFALVSAALQDVYSAQDPAAAQGVAVDYQLALIGLTRLIARPTVTNPVPDTTSTGIVLPGLVLYGTPGTLIPKGSIIQTASEPTLQFTTDADATIGLAQNALQQIIFSQAPTAGTYTLSLTASSGQSLSSAPLPYNASAQSVQDAIYSLVDTDGLYPFTDVVVSQTSAQIRTIAFGAGALAQNQPASAAAAQPAIAATTQGLVAGSSLVNISIIQSVVGQPAQATTTATCRIAGPSVVSAHTLNVIGSSITGWTGADNPLDCITGANTETDTEAYARRRAALAARGSGTLAGIVTKVLAVPGVSAALSFENKTQAAQQILSLSAAPTGSFALVVGGQTTAPIAPPVSATSVQSAINALPGLDVVKVTGSVTYGFTVDFNGAQGGQAQALIAVTANASGVIITPSFGRPPKSFEIVAQGGADAAIAQAILDSSPAGMASYGAPSLRTTGTTVAGSNQVTLASVSNLAVGQNLAGQGLQAGSLVTAISGTTATVSLAALGSANSVPMLAQAALLLQDAQGNPHLISYSRPTPALLYINCRLITDYFNSPGDSTSGQSAQASFDPASLSTVQTDLMAAAAQTPIGGLLLARGTAGLAGSFRTIPGVLDYTLAFDIVPNPTNTQNLQLLPEQYLSVQQSNVSVSFT